MLLRILTAVVLSTLLGTCSSPPSLLQQIVRSGELRVVTRNSPATFYDAHDEPRGIEYELARGYADRLGIGLKIYSARQFWQLFPDVINGTAHIGAAGLTITDARQEIVDFGPTYQDVEQQIIYRRGTKRPHQISDMLGGRIEVIEGSSHVGLLERERNTLPELTWTSNPRLSTEESVRRVARGDVDYTIIDSNAFQLLRHHYPEARVAFSLGPVNKLAWVLSKESPALRESVAAYFAEIQSTGELQEILDRNYFASREFDYVGSRAFVRHLDTRLPAFKEMFQEAALDTDIDWRLLAAIAYQESHWDPNAVSPTGVRGIMMLTEHTAQMINIDDRRDPQQSIRGGAQYLRRILKKIPERIPNPDRLWLAMAAYNIGFGHVEDSRIITEIQGGNPDRWDEVRERLPLLSEEDWYSRVRRGYAPGSVPVRYVDNVRRYYEMLLWMAGRAILSKEPPLLIQDLIALTRTIGQTNEFSAAREKNL